MSPTTPFGPVPHEFKDLSPQEIRAYLIREIQQAPKADRIERAIALAEWAANGLASPRDRIICCRLLARRAMYAGEFSTAHQWLQKAQTLAGTVPRLLAEVEIAVATVFNAERRIDEAITRLESVHSTLDPVEEPELVARALTILASAYDDRGDISKADDIYTELLALRERIGDESGLAVTYYNYAERCARRDDHGTAYDFFMRSYDIEKRNGMQQGLAQTVCQIALIEALRGHADEALRLSREAMSLAREVGSPVITSYCMANHCSALSRLGLVDECHAALQEAIAFTEPFNLPHILGPLVGDLGEVLFKLGNIEESVLHFERALEISIAEGYMYGEANWKLGLGKARMEQGNYASAEVLLSQAVKMFSDLSTQAMYLNAVFELAKLHHRMNTGPQSTETLIRWMEQYKEDQERRQIALLDVVHRRYERERQSQEAEIFRLRNVELTSAMQRLQELNKELQDLANEKDEFMAVAAHDLRTPLSNIRGLITHALTHADRLSHSESMEVLSSVRETTDRMLVTVYHFLDVSRNDKRGSMIAHEIIDVNDVVRDALYRHLRRATEKGISIRMPIMEPIWASADMAVTDAIFDNLVSNAIKFSPEGSEVVVTTSRNENDVLVRVRDNGPGIPDHERRLLFTKYGRLSTQPTGGEESLGLGLYLAARLAKRVDGAITCDSLVGSGTTFTVRLKAALPSDLP